LQKDFYICSVIENKKLIIENKKAIERYLSHTLINMLFYLFLNISSNYLHFNINNIIGSVKSSRSKI